MKFPDGCPLSEGNHGAALGMTTGCGLGTTVAEVVASVAIHQRCPLLMYTRERAMAIVGGAPDGCPLITMSESECERAIQRAYDSRPDRRLSEGLYEA